MSVVSYDSSQLLLFVKSSSQYLVSYQTTHHLRNSNFFLDLCIVDDPVKISKFGQYSIPFLSAHDLIYMHYKINVERGCRRKILDGSVEISETLVRLTFFRTCEMIENEFRIYRRKSEHVE